MTNDQEREIYDELQRMRADASRRARLTAERHSHLDSSLAELDMRDRHGYPLKRIAEAERRIEAEQKPADVPGWMYWVGGMFATLLLAVLAVICWWWR